MEGAMRQMMAVACAYQAGANGVEGTLVPALLGEVRFVRNVYYKNTIFQIFSHPTGSIWPISCTISCDTKVKKKILKNAFSNLLPLIHTRIGSLLQVPMCSNCLR